VAGNGKTGLDLVQTRKEKGGKQFDIVLMDIHMPVMDGLEASAKILELETGVPVVAMTANIMAHDMEIYGMSGMRDCIGKPFTSQELWHCLMKYLTPVTQDPAHMHAQVEADMEFQKKLHILFLKNNENKFAEITKALREDDIKQAHRLAHTLKGNAGQLGKNILQQAAADIEHKLKEGKNLTTVEQLKTLEIELNAVLSHIKTEFAELLEDSSRLATRSGYASEWFDAESVRELIEKLELTLKMGSPDCQKYIDAIRLIPGNDELKTRLIKHMEDFDFDASIAMLAELRKKY
jgi:CheY-like chemotaxis protein